MLRAILDVSETGLFDHQHTMNEHHSGCAYLFSESRINTRKSDEITRKPDFAGKIWFSMHIDTLNKVEDLKTVHAHHVDTLVLRGCKGPQHVEKASVLLTVSEIESGLNRPETRIIASIADTAIAVQSLSKWTDLPDRLSGLLFDPAALARSMGLASPTNSQGQRLPILETAAHMSLFAAHALSCPIYDATLWDHHSNPSEQYYRAREMGFAGAFTRKPDHVDLITAIFA